VKIYSDEIKWLAQKQSWSARPDLSIFKGRHLFCLRTGVSRSKEQLSSYSFGAQLGVGKESGNIVSFKIFSGPSLYVCLGNFPLHKGASSCSVLILNQALQFWLLVPNFYIGLALTEVKWLNTASNAQPWELILGILVIKATYGDLKPKQPKAIW